MEAATGRTDTRSSRRLRRAVERALDGVRVGALGQVDDEHHREVAAEDRHAGILDVSAVLEQDLGDGGGDAGPVGPNRGHCNLHVGQRTIRRMKLRMLALAVALLLLGACGGKGRIESLSGVKVVLGSGATALTINAKVAATPERSRRRA